MGRAIRNTLLLLLLLLMLLLMLLVMLSACVTYNVTQCGGDERGPEPP